MFADLDKTIELVHSDKGASNSMLERIRIFLCQRYLEDFKFAEIISSVN